MLSLGRAQEMLTNESILTMVRAGLPEGVIVAKIRSSQTRFDLSTDALIKLKQAGVPDRALETMASQGAPPGSPAVATQPPAPAPFSIPAAGVGIYHMDAGKLVELRQRRGKLEATAGPSFRKVELVIPSRRAEFRISDRQPVFLATYFPAGTELARLRPGGKDDRNLKMMKQTGPFGATLSTGIDEDAIVRVTVERDSQGRFLIRPSAPLAPGEYGFVFSMMIWDFGID